MSISYLEIYNEVGYDLLDPAREVAALEDMPQVFFQEDEEGRLHLRNLSAHRAATEEDALNLVGLPSLRRFSGVFQALQLENFLPGLVLQVSRWLCGSQKEAYANTVKHATVPSHILYSQHPN